VKSPPGKGRLSDGGGPPGKIGGEGISPEKHTKGVGGQKTKTEAMNFHTPGKKDLKQDKTIRIFPRSPNNQ